ncbi:hypothetical protein KQH82_07355 [bacterium]|nr:hypothetical protein [bacterium]
MSDRYYVPRQRTVVLRAVDFGVLFAPRYNRNRIVDGDASRRESPHDADHFQGCARDFCETNGSDRFEVQIIDNGRNATTQEGDANDQSARRQQILDWLTDYSGPLLRVVSFVCHGYRDGIQLGFSIRNAPRRAETDQLLDLLAQKCRPDLVIPIYACSTGSSGRGEEGGEGGFADYLRDGLCARGIVRCRIDAHTEVADAVACPHVRRFRGHNTTAGAEGGEWIVDPSEELFGDWRRALRETDLKYRYPLMSKIAVQAELLMPS